MDVGFDWVSMCQLGGIYTMGILAMSAQLHGLEHTMGVRRSQPFPCSFWFNRIIAEIPIVFGTYDTPGAIPPSAREVEVSEYMQGNPFQDKGQELPRLMSFLGAWVAFAKDPCMGLSEYGWPQFSFDGKCAVLLFSSPADHQIAPTLVNLALNNTVEAIFTSASPWDTSCEAPTRSELWVFGIHSYIVVQWS